MDELDAVLQAVRGFLGGVSAVNESIERRADSCLCLLLVSAAALTVASVPAPDTTVSGDSDRADSVAETLAANRADLPRGRRRRSGSLAHARSPGAGDG